MKRIDSDVRSKEIIYGMIRFHADNIQDISLLDIDEEKGEIMDYILNALGFEHVSDADNINMDHDHDILSNSAASPKSIQQRQEQIMETDGIQQNENKVQTPNIHMLNTNNSI